MQLANTVLLAAAQSVIIHYKTLSSYII